MRAAGWWTRVTAGAGEAVGVGEIYSESSAGPVVGPMYGVVDDDLPPIEAPLLGPVCLLPGLPKDACYVLDDLVGADGAFHGTPDLRVFANSGGFDGEENCEDANCRRDGGEHQTEAPQHEHRKGNRNDD